MKNTFKPRPDETGRLCEDDVKKYYTRIGIATAALSLLCFLLRFLPQFINIENPALELGVRYGIVFVGLTLIGIPLTKLLLSSLPSDHAASTPISAKHFLAGITVCFLIYYIGSGAENAIFTFTSLFLPLSESSITTDVPSIIVRTVFAGILIPIVDAIIVEHIFCQKLLPLGEAPATFIGGFIFAMFSSDVYSFVFSFLLGSYLCYICVKTGNYAVTIIYHVVTNIFVSVLLPVSAALLNKIPAEEWEKAMLSLTESPEELTAFFTKNLSLLIPGVIIAYVIMGFSIVGFITALRAISKKRIKFATGLLPPPADRKLLNFFLSGGIAAAIAVFILTNLLTFIMLFKS